MILRLTSIMLVITLMMIGIMVIAIVIGGVFPSLQIAYIVETDEGYLNSPFHYLLLFDVGHRLESVLGNPPWVYDLYWSHDGQYLSYMVATDGLQTALRIFDLETFQEKYILTTSGWTGNLGWSHDDQFIALHGRESIMLVDPVTGEIVDEVRIVNLDTGESLIYHDSNTFQWSEDDQSFIVYGAVNGQANIYQINIETGVITEYYDVDIVYDTLGYVPERIPVIIWSPNYETLAIFSGRLYLFNRSTGEITTLDLSLRAPRWSTDSSQLAVTNFSTHTYIYMMDSDGSNLRGVLYSDRLSSLRATVSNATIRPR